VKIFFLKKGTQPGTFLFFLKKGTRGTQPRSPKKKNSGNGCGTKSVLGPRPGAGGEEGCGRGAGVFIKARNAHPRPGSRLPRRRARGFSHISAISRSTPAFVHPWGRAGAGLRCPDSAGYNPACPSRVPKGRAQDGYQNEPAGLGLSHILAFPAQSVPMPTPKRRAGAGLLWSAFSIPNTHRVFGSNGNGPISSLMLRTASALALALFLAGMLNA
jgi:hypothetical protein